MNQQDLRYVKTEDLIKEAFLSCAAEYDIQNIHIKDICARARISRNAFYSHYENKYQVLEAICNETEEKMIKALDPETVRKLSNNIMYSTTEWCIRTMYENKHVFQVMARCSEISFRRMIHNIFIKATLAALYENTDAIEKDIILQMSEAFITNGLTGIIILWLQDPDRISQEDFADFLHEIGYGPIDLFYKKLDENKTVRRKRIHSET